MVQSFYTVCRTYGRFLVVSTLLLPFLAKIAIEIMNNNSGLSLDLSNLPVMIWWKCDEDYNTYPWFANHLRWMLMYT